MNHADFCDLSACTQGRVFSTHNTGSLGLAPILFTRGGYAHVEGVHILCLPLIMKNISLIEVDKKQLEIRNSTLSISF